MDNFRFHMVCEGPTLLQQAMELVFNYQFNYQKDLAKRSTAVYAIKPAEGKKPVRLVLYWSDTASTSNPTITHPFPMNASEWAAFATRWLETVNYGSQPDHDGSNGRGWTVYNEAWGHVDGDYRAFIAISPAWAMYGK